MWLWDTTNPFWNHEKGAARTTADKQHIHPAGRHPVTWDVLPVNDSLWTLKWCWKLTGVTLFASNSNAMFCINTLYIPFLFLFGLGRMSASNNLVRWNNAETVLMPIYLTDFVFCIPSWTKTMNTQTPIASCSGTQMTTFFSFPNNFQFFFFF